MGVSRQRWRDLSPHSRRLIMAGAAVDGALKIAALADLARRPQDEVRGPRLAWAVAITLVNSAGALPIIYFARGRQR